MALYKRRRAKYDENVIKTAPDTRRAQGNAEDDDFEAEPEEITTSLPRKRKRPGSTAVAAKGPAFAFMKLPAEVSFDHFHARVLGVLTSARFGT